MQLCRSVNCGLKSELNSRAVGMQEMEFSFINFGFV